MARRSYSVLVDPDRGSDSVEELARRLGPLTRQSPDRLVGILERGAVTLETDLQLSEAERLFGQLERRGCPAEIRDGDGEVVDAVAPADAPEEANEEESDLETSAGESDHAFDLEPSDAEEPEAVLEFGPAKAPDAAPESEDAPEKEPSPAEDAPELPELEFSDASPAPEPSTSPESPSPGEPSDPTPTVPNSGSGDDRFDAAKMSEALEGEVATPDGGGESRTFEHRPAHVPALAAVLSALAPGAGQAYNGDSDRVWRDTARALLLVPWIGSVRQALERARAIRRGEAPRPPEGSFGRALVHAGLLWTAMAAVGLGIWAASGLIGDVREPAETGAVADRATPTERALKQASVEVQEARLAAWERAGRRKVDDDERYTMSRGERAARLYRIGYRHCRAGEFGMCESLMRKVAKLDSEYRRSAYRLQVWANQQRRDDAPDAPMPDVLSEVRLDAGSPEEIAKPPDAGTLSEGRPGDGGR